jgi:hypothetical protein
LSIAKGGAQRQQPVFTGIVVNNFNFNFNFNLRETEGDRGRMGALGEYNIHGRD